MKEWKSIDFGSVPSGLSNRELAEEETRRDLQKPIEQLLSDVHEEVNHPGRSPEVNIAHANKRMVSLMARAAISNERTSTRLLWLTWVLVALTIVIAALTVLMIVQMKNPS